MSVANRACQTGVRQFAMNFHFLNFQTRIKRYIFPVAALLVSWYISFLFVLGVVIGYVSTHFCHKKITSRNRLRAVYLNLGGWRVHFHHWLMGVTGLVFLWMLNVLHFFPAICWGLAGGLIFHDIYSDKDWYKVLIKRSSV